MTAHNMVVKMAATVILLVSKTTRAPVQTNSPEVAARCHLVSKLLIISISPTFYKYSLSFVKKFLKLTVGSAI